MKDDHVRKPLYSFWSYLTTGWLQTIVHQYSTFLRIATQPLKNHFFGFRLSQCLKITEKVAFNIVSEASYVYILSGQKLIKNAKKVHFGEFLKI